MRRTQTLVVHPADLDTKKIADFMEAQGAAWGARRDVIDRASFNLAQSIETIVEGCDPEGPLEIEASFDEFSLDLRVSYAGAPLELPDGRPTDEEPWASEEGQRKSLASRSAGMLTACSRCNWLGLLHDPLPLRPRSR